MGSDRDNISGQAAPILSELMKDPDRMKASLWKDLCPDLSIDESKTVEPKKCPSSKALSEKRRNKLITNGFALVDEKFDDALITKLRNGITALHNKHLPASFIFLFDEAWELARDSQKSLSDSAHEMNCLNFDLLAWYIENGSGGFSPHRDRQPDDAKSTFHGDGQAKFVTQWIALSDATPENSCLHVIPKPFDPGYLDGDSEKEDPLRRSLPDKHSYQNIRAIPRQSGQSLLFTHRIIHWGSKADIDSTTPPRIAISFVCSDPSYEAPLVDPKYFTDEVNPPFRIRLLLVCAQLLIYYQRFELDKAIVKACYDLCKANESELEEAYRKKVFYEFVQAMKEHSNGNEEEQPNQDTKVGEINGDDDEEEALMEEMLNSEAAGYGEFEDDYDELDDDEEGAAPLQQDGEESSDEDEEEGVDLFSMKEGDYKPPKKKVKR